jgi:hypothetical protein
MRRQWISTKVFFCFTSRKHRHMWIRRRRHREQDCQMVYFQNKNCNSGTFRRVLQWKMLVYFTAIWYILWTFGTFCIYLVHFSPFWYIVPRKIWQPGPWSLNGVSIVLFPLRRYFCIFVFETNYCQQGGQVRLWKNRPKCSPTRFCPKCYLCNFYLGKSSPKILATSVIYKITIQSMRTPNSRKYAQSGHPDYQPLWPLAIFVISFAHVHR